MPSPALANKLRELFPANLQSTFLVCRRHLSHEARVDRKMIDDNTPNYAFDNAHYFLSSSQSSSCSVEPGSTPDVSKIVRYIFLVLLSASADHVTSSLVEYFGKNPHAICDHGRRVCYEPGIFFDTRRANFNEALRRDQS